jgi:D-amino peptidase
MEFAGEDSTVRVFISADMEGVTGLVAASELLPDGPDYPRFRALMTADVNATIDGLVAGGAASVLVCDAHNNSRNILIEDLHPAARLIRGGTKPLGMMEGIAASFAAACFVGYHAMFGTHRAIADHTWDPYAVQAVTINGRLVGEIGLNAALAGWFGVPVALVTGDDATARETADLLPWAERVIVKEAKGRFAADCLLPAASHALIRAGATNALAHLGRMEPWRIEGATEIDIAFFTAGQAERAAWIPGADPTAPRIVACRGADFWQAYRLYWAAVYLGGDVNVF